MTTSTCSWINSLLKMSVLPRLCCRIQSILRKILTEVFLKPDLLCRNTYIGSKLKKSKGIISTTLGGRQGGSWGLPTGLHCHSQCSLLSFTVSTRQSFYLCLCHLWYTPNIKLHVYFFPFVQRKYFRQKGTGRSLSHES